MLYCVILEMSSPVAVQQECHRQGGGMLHAFLNVVSRPYSNWEHQCRDPPTSALLAHQFTLFRCINISERGLLPFDQAGREASLSLD